MAATTAPAALAALQWRYATKHFDAKRRISAQDWSTLQQALILAPSSFGLQPWKFLVIEDAALRAELQGHAWNQAQVSEASHVVVFAVKLNLNAADVESHIQRIAKVRAVSLESLQTYKSMILGFINRDTTVFDVNAWATRQVYIALGVFLTTAAMLGIDACPMEGFDPQKFNKVLELEKVGYSAVVMATAGYRSAEDPYANAQKVRFASESIIETF